MAGRKRGRLDSGIDGVAATPRRSGRIRRSSRYVTDQDAPVSAASIHSRCRTASSNAQTTPALKRARKRNDSFGNIRVSNTDERFLASMIAQVKDAERRLPIKEGQEDTQRRFDLATVGPFLEIMQRPSEDRVHQSILTAAGTREEPVVYHLTPGEAREILNVNKILKVPIFVTNGMKQLFDPNPCARRPTEQALEWFTDLLEVQDANVPDRVAGSEERRKIGDIKTRFLEQNGGRQFPWNFPDLPNPMLDSGMPDFLKSSKCNFLHDMMRYVNVDEPEKICQDECPDKKKHSEEDHCQKHFASLDEHMVCAQVFKSWRGALMMAEGGAITNAHWDRFGLGTWLTCFEGELGLAWQGEGSFDEQSQWLMDCTKVQGRWYYKVIRPGDALYMPPGTVHQVFRRPDGLQTLCAVGHIIRRPDLSRWLDLSITEAERNLESQIEALRKAECGLHYGEVVVNLMNAAEHFLSKDVLAKEQIPEYGGEQAIIKAREKIGLVRGMARSCRRLAETRFRADSASNAQEKAKAKAQETLRRVRQAKRSGNERHTQKANKPAALQARPQRSVVAWKSSDSEASLSSEPVVVSRRLRPATMRQRTKPRTIVFPSRRRR